MQASSEEFKALEAATRKLASEVAAKHAADVDRDARFPNEAVAAMRAARLLSAPVPPELGGAGCSMLQLGTLVNRVAQSCASSAMVLAMHYIQVACIARHHAQSPLLRTYLQDLSEKQLLLASMTSENGTFGDTRSSICAVELDGERFRLTKDATTGSYCAQSDAILVTARRAGDAAASDQVLVLVRREDAALVQTTSWDTLGMRGTCSPGFKLESSGAAAQVLPEPFADISAQTMVPYSHILWASLWAGIADDAYGKAAAFVRGQARKTPGSVPPTAQRLAALSVQLQGLDHNWQTLARDFDTMVEAGSDASGLQTMGWALKMNNLKIACSEAAPHLVHAALQIVGILGYKNDSPFSLGRQYRDSLSGALMVSNDRILAKNASMLLVFKDD